MRLLKAVCIGISLFFIALTLSCNMGSSLGGDQIIADHSIVDDYSQIPQEYLDIIKTWLVDAAGESHSEAYRTGISDLELLHDRFQVETFTSGIPTLSSSYLRLGRHGSIGEEDFWTNDTAVSNIKSLVLNQHNSGNPIHVIFQAWCWDLTRTSSPIYSGAMSEYDSVYGCRWYGSTSGGPQGDRHWGLDAADASLTGNNLSLQSYLDVIEEFNLYFKENGLDCIAVYSTGPVDGDSALGEKGYQRYIKHQAIRNHVRQNSSRILFDYADILAYSNDGEYSSATWTSPYNGETYRFPTIHSRNDAEETGHISNEGALRLAKAMWWMLARMAGWEG